MGKPSAPTPPDPLETAAASTGTNVSTAIANTLLGQVGQQGPMGSLSYQQTGTTSFTDPTTGETYEIPQYTATTSLSPELQGITQGIQARIGDIVGGLGATGFDTSDVEGRLFELGQQRIDPVLDRDRAALEAQLANQGLVPGSEAWNAQMGAFNQRANDAYNQLALQGRGQAFGELMAMRQAPINEITALLGGQQMATPQYNIATPGGIPTTDVAGLINQGYSNQMGQYGQQMQNYQNTMGGLFGLGAALISDVRAKTDIKKIGQANGLNVYEYKYLWSGIPQVGYMAQEVEQVFPRAVVQVGDYKAVNYGEIGNG